MKRRITGNSQRNFRKKGQFNKDKNKSSFGDYGNKPNKQGSKKGKKKNMDKELEKVEKMMKKQREGA